MAWGSFGPNGANSLDAFQNGGSDAAWVATGGLAQCVGTSAATHDSFLYWTSSSTYDSMDSTEIAVEVVTHDAAGRADCEHRALQLYTSSSNYGAFWLLATGGIRPYYRNGGSNTALTFGGSYNSSTMRWFFIRGDASTFYFEYADSYYGSRTLVDSVAFSTVFSGAPGGEDVDNLLCMAQVNNWGTNSGETTLELDNFNGLSRGRQILGARDGTDAGASLTQWASGAPAPNL